MNTTCTIQRADNRNRCAGGWVPLAHGVPILGREEQDGAIVLQVPFLANVRGGERVLIEQAERLAVIAVEADDRRSLTLFCERSKDVSD
ncbi:MAG: hypothetical protein MUE50_05505 [Pirellulaceae bacterium]|jgi:hypothetical protein|nr:hypothetical protein [Pirellulaceae bacterium]